MKEAEFLAELQDIMDMEEALTMETDLAELEEWDSVSQIAFLAFAAQQGSSKLLPEIVKNAKTPAELYQLLVA